MKTLSQLIKEAEERFDEKAKYVWYTKDPVYGQENERDRNNFKVFFSKELTNIVKESFKNTKVEEAVVSVTSLDMIPINAGGALQVASNFGRNQALSDKHNKECEFLRN